MIRPIKKMSANRLRQKIRYGRQRLPPFFEDDEVEVRLGRVEWGSGILAEWM